MTKNNLAQKRLFLFDIDGTLSVGDTLFEGSRQLLSYIEDIGGKSYFITNNSTKSPADYVEKFRASFGLVATKQQFMTSGQVTLDFLKTHFHDQTIFCVGTASYITQLRSQGIRVTQVPEESVACVLVAYDDELTYEKLVYACRILCTKDVPYYATNPDLCCPSAFGFVPDCGAICNLLRDSCQKTPIYLGKPNPEMVLRALADSGFTKEQTLVVGDRLYTDILCGKNAGVDTCVVYTGEATPDDLSQSLDPPEYTFATVKELWECCVKQGENDIDSHNQL